MSWGLLQEKPRGISIEILQVMFQRMLGKVRGEISSGECFMNPFKECPQGMSQGRENILGVCFRANLANYLVKYFSQCFRECSGECIKKFLLGNASRNLLRMSQEMLGWLIWGNASRYASQIVEFFMIIFSPYLRKSRSINKKIKAGKICQVGAFWK